MAEYLAHYGVPKMKWGVRRWQNEDGSLTPAGRIHYGRKLERAKNTSQGLKIQADTLATFRPMATGAGGVMAGVSGTTVMNTLPSVISSQITDPQKALLIGGAAAVGMATVQASYRLASAGERWLASRQDRKIKEIEKILRDSDEIEANKPKQGSNDDAGTSKQFVSYYPDKKAAEMLEIDNEVLSRRIENNRNSIESAMEGYKYSSSGKSPKNSDIAEFLKDCAWIANNHDPDHILDQVMDEYIEAYKDGKMSNKAFSNVFDAKLADYASTLATYDAESIKRIRDTDSEYPDRTYEHYLADLGVEVRRDPVAGSYKSSEPSGRYSKAVSNNFYIMSTGDSTMYVAKKGQSRNAYVTVKDPKTKKDVHISTVNERATAQAMANMGYTQEEIAKKLNFSESTVAKWLK